EHEDDDGRIDDVPLGIMIDAVDRSSEHPHDHGHRHQEHDLLIEGERTQRHDRDDRTEGDAAAQNTPVGLAQLTGLELDEQCAGHGNGGHQETAQEYGLVGDELRQPTRDAGHGEYAKRQRQATEHLYHAEIVVDLALRARRTVRVPARHYLGAHRVGHDVLHD